VEFKFNGWHDADDGKFTHVGAGRYFPPGSRAAPKPRPSGSGKRAAPAYTVHDPRNPSNYSVVQVRRGDTLTKLAESRRGLTGSDLAWLNQLDPNRALQIGQPIKVPHQSFLERGRDARNRFLALAYHMDKHGGQLPPDVANPPSLDQQLADERTRVVANGYAFDRDGLNRTREVTGRLQLNPEQGRSRRAQAEAGASDRRATDEGGHIIARRSMVLRTHSITSPKIARSIAASTERSRIVSPDFVSRGQRSRSTFNCCTKRSRAGPINYGSGIRSMADM
jgi:LysM repeat protein